MPNLSEDILTEKPPLPAQTVPRAGCCHHWPQGIDLPDQSCGHPDSPAQDLPTGTRDPETEGIQYGATIQRGWLPRGRDPEALGSPGSFESLPTLGVATQILPLIPFSEPLQGPPSALPPCFP